MESFEIKISHEGTEHLLRIECDSEDPEYRVFRGEEPIGTLKPGINQDLNWISDDIQDKEFLEKIGDRIENYLR